MKTATEAAKKPRRSRRAKIAIIGGGSLYCADSLKHLIENAEELKGCHITLMDVDTEGLDLIYTLGIKMFHLAGSALTLERTTIREEAIKDADFVLTTFRTGGHQARYLDERIPLKYGLIGHDTVGPGSFFYAL